MSRFTGKLFVLYGGRANTGNFAVAAVVATADCEREAREVSHWFRGCDVTWFEHEITEGRIVAASPRLDLLVA